MYSSRFVVMRQLPLVGHSAVLEALARVTHGLTNCRGAGFLTCRHSSKRQVRKPAPR